MKIVTWNVRGLGSKGKRAVIRSMLMGVGADIIILQETKLPEVKRSLVSSIWGAHFKD